MFKSAGLWLRRCADLRLTSAGLAWLGALLFWGTVHQASHGLESAQALYFHSWFFLVAGAIPLPGAMSVFALLLLNLLAAMAVRLPRRRTHLGLWFLHGAVLTFLLGAGISHYVAIEGLVELTPGAAVHRAQIAGAVAANGQKEWDLPIELRLLESRWHYHPGTQILEDLEARVHWQIRHEGVASPEDREDGEALLRLNEPLRWKSYTFYLADVAILGDSTEVIALVLRKDSVAWWPYAACVLLCLGLLAQVWGSWNNKVGFSVLCVIMIAPVGARAAGLPAIQMGGRVQPMEVWASHLQVQITGRSSAKALPWLERILFDEGIDSVPLFRLRHAATPATLGLPPRRPPVYSAMELEGVLFVLERSAVRADSVPAGRRTGLERDLLHLWNAHAGYRQLREAFSFVQPSRDFTPRDSLAAARLLLEQKPQSFLAVEARLPLLMPWIDSLLAQPQRQWSPADSGAWQLARALHQWAFVHGQNRFVIFPGATAETAWSSPWQVLRDAALAPTQRAALHQLVQNPEMFEVDSIQGTPQFRAWLQEIQEDGLGDAVLQRLAWESRWHRWGAAAWAELLLWLAASLAWWGRGTWKSSHTTAVGLAVAGGVALFVELALRTGITGRPPVTNLHESLLFVAAISLALAAFLGRRHTHLPWVGVAVAALLLRLAAWWSAGQDTIGVLVAILDSPFWLLTHVLVITAGYGAVLVAGVFAQVELWRMARGHAIAQNATALLRRLLLLGLALTTVGTVLGGFWAQQAWGRFWGWDPKENGALFLILWITLLLHARKAGWLGRVGLWLGAGASVPVVAMAWIGVNLLGVGLHSYGFRTGHMVAFLTGVGLQIVLLGVLGWLAAGHTQKNKQIREE